MFREITIVKLIEADKYLDYSLPWQLCHTRVHNDYNNAGLLRYSRCMPKQSSLGSMLLYQDGLQARDVLLPAHYHRVGRSLYHEWVSDLGEAQYIQLTNSLREVFPHLQIDPKHQYWILSDAPVSEKHLIEAEMMLYNHSVNQHRKENQQVEVSGVEHDRSQRLLWLRPKKIYTNHNVISRARKCSGSVMDWLAAPCVNVTIVLGRDLGPFVHQSLQDTLVEFLDKNVCHAVHFVLPGQHMTYTTNYFHHFRKQYLR